MRKHTLTHQQAHELLSCWEALQLSPSAMNRLRCIVHFLINGQNAEATCAEFHISRSTLVRWLERFDPSNIASLEEHSRMPHQVRKSSVTPEIVALIRTYRERNHFIGKETIAVLLQEQHGVNLSASSIGRIIDREGMYFGNTPLHWRKRMERAPVQDHQRQDIYAQQQEWNEAPSQPLYKSPIRIVEREAYDMWQTLKKASFISAMIVNTVMLMGLMGIAMYEYVNEDRMEASVQQVEAQHTSTPFFDFK